jgi:hypothetical protein
MGIPNMVEGRVRAVDADGIVVDTVIGPLWTRSWRDGWGAGDRCAVAVRPTLITFDPDPQGGARPGRVVRSVFQGTSTIHLVEVDGTVITVESFAEDRHAEGTTVAVRPVSGAAFALLDD